MYTSLNDSAVYVPSLSAGATKIWYYKPSVSRFITFGEVKIDPLDLGKTHVLLGSVQETNLDTLFGALQGEAWSPEGEARELIRSKELSHTSMSVGDVVEVHGKAYVCRPMGWAELLVGGELPEA